MHGFGARFEGSSLRPGVEARTVSKFGGEAEGWVIAIEGGGSLTLAIAVNGTEAMRLDSLDLSGFRRLRVEAGDEIAVKVAAVVGEVRSATLRVSYGRVALRLRPAI